MERWMQALKETYLHMLEDAFGPSIAEKRKETSQPKGFWQTVGKDLVRDVRNLTGQDPYLDVRTTLTGPTPQTKAEAPKLPNPQQLETDILLTPEAKERLKRLGYNTSNPTGTYFDPNPNRRPSSFKKSPMDELPDLN